MLNKVVILRSQTFPRTIRGEIFIVQCYYSLLCNKNMYMQIPNVMFMCNVVYRILDISHDPISTLILNTLLLQYSTLQYHNNIINVKVCEDVCIFVPQSGQVYR